MEIDQNVLEMRIGELRWAAQRMHDARLAVRDATDACAEAVFLAVEAGLSRKQAVKITGVAPDTVSRWANRGDL